MLGVIPSDGDGIRCQPRECEKRNHRAGLREGFPGRRFERQRLATVAVVDRSRDLPIDISRAIDRDEGDELACLRWEEKAGVELGLDSNGRIRRERVLEQHEVLVPRWNPEWN